MHLHNMIDDTCYLGRLLPLDTLLIARMGCRSFDASSPAESPKSVLRFKRVTRTRPRVPAVSGEIIRNSPRGRSTLCKSGVATVFDRPHLRSGYLDVEGDAPQLTSKEVRPETRYAGHPADAFETRRPARPGGTLSGLAAAMGCSRSA